VTITQDKAARSPCHRSGRIIWGLGFILTPKRYDHLRATIGCLVCVWRKCLRVWKVYGVRESSRPEAGDDAWASRRFRIWESVGRNRTSKALNRDSPSWALASFDVVSSLCPGRRLSSIGDLKPVGDGNGAVVAAWSHCRWWPVVACCWAGNPLSWNFPVFAGVQIAKWLEFKKAARMRRKLVDRRIPGVYTSPSSSVDTFSWWNIMSFSRETFDAKIWGLSVLWTFSNKAEKGGWLTVLSGLDTAPSDRPAASVVRQKIVSKQSFEWLKLTVWFAKLFWF
jgi:hypothetical protein